MEVFKVAQKSNPNAVAGEMVGAIREHEDKKQIELQAIGSGAINQAVKAIIIARGFMAPSGIDLICIPAFADIQMEGEERTAVKLIVQAR